MNFVFIIFIILVSFNEIDRLIAEDSEKYVVIYNDFDEDGDYQRNAIGNNVMIFPGTKWCGPGNIASDNEDLGQLVEVDKCCRAHDHCDAIPSGETKYGLTNNTPYTKLHCKCDKTFYKCLKDEGSIAAKTIGDLYSMGNNICYKNSYPIVECHRYHYYFFMRRCVDYVVDSSQPQKYQFFDLPFFNDSDDFLSRRSLNNCMAAKSYQIE